MAAGARRTIRVLAAEDSAVMRNVLRTLFDRHALGDAAWAAARAAEPGAYGADPSVRVRKLPQMELCGIARDGVEALEAVERLLPDVLLLDLEMPRMDGLAVLERLRTLAPRLPVIMCSAQTQRGARATFTALRLGAKDYVLKPSQQANRAEAMDELADALLPKVAEWGGASDRSVARTLCLPGVEAQPQRPAREPVARMSASQTLLAGSPSAGTSASAGVVEIVVVGVSTGGPLALETVLPLLPGNFPAPILIVQHMPRLFTGVLAERLNRLCRLQVGLAEDGAALEPGKALLAPGDAHLEVCSGLGGAAVRLHHGPALNSCKPSVDYLFRSAAQLFGGGTLALMLTGMGSDGLEGARAVHRAGGVVLAQDEASSAVWGMPGRVVQEGLAQEVLPLALIAGALLQRTEVSTGGTRRPGAGESTRASQARHEVAYGLL